MRQVSAQLLDPESLIELKSGHRLQLVQGGRTIAEIVPALQSEESQFWKSEEERLSSGKELMDILHKGFDLGGFRIENRDELYDRD